MSAECDGKCESCSKKSDCTDPRKELWEEQQRLKQNISKIKHKIAVTLVPIKLLSSFGVC